MQLILVGTGAATIWIMPFMDYWDNVISITSMGGRPLLPSCITADICKLRPEPSPQALATTGPWHDGTCIEASLASAKSLETMSWS